MCQRGLPFSTSCFDAIYPLSRICKSYHCVKLYEVTVWFCYCTEICKEHSNMQELEIMSPETTMRVIYFVLLLPIDFFSYIISSVHAHSNTCSHIQKIVLILNCSLGNGLKLHQGRLKPDIRKNKRVISTGTGCPGKWVSHHP